MYAGRVRHGLEQDDGPAYALAVQVNGQTVGYVANEEVFNLAKEDVMQRINYAGSDKTELTIEPTYTISVTHKTMDESETANAILQSASDQISEGTALYLDGELTASAPMVTPCAAIWRACWPPTRIRQTRMSAWALAKM